MGSEKISPSYVKELEQGLTQTIKCVKGSTVVVDNLFAVFVKNLGPHKAHTFIICEDSIEIQKEKSLGIEHPERPVSAGKIGSLRLSFSTGMNRTVFIGGDYRVTCSDIHQGETTFKITSRNLPHLDYHEQTDPELIKDILREAHIARNHFKVSFT